MVSEELNAFIPFSWSLPKVVVASHDIAMWNAKIFFQNVINHLKTNLQNPSLKFARNVILTVLSDIVHFLSCKISSLQPPASRLPFNP